MTLNLPTLFEQRLHRLQRQRDLALRGLEKHRMSPELAEALRNEIRQALDAGGKPFDINVARRVYDLAIAAKDMCAAATAGVSEAIKTIADNNGPIESLGELEPGEPAVQAQASETFGARLIRELLATFKLMQPKPYENPGDLVLALADARRNGMTDVAAELEAKLFGRTLTGDKPIAPAIVDGTRDVEEGSWEHGFADGKANNPPFVMTGDYHHGYLKGLEEHYLEPAPPLAKPLAKPLKTVKLGATVGKIYDGPCCQDKGQCESLDGSGACSGCGRWLGGGEVPHVDDPPLCATCVADPDPRGGSACFSCRQVRAGRCDNIKHVFRPRLTDRFAGPVGETCEYCGRDPRNTIHVGHDAAVRAAHVQGATP